MKLLAIETADLYGSVALTDDGRTFLSDDLPRDQRSAESLVPAIGKLLARSGWKPSDLDVLAVAVGPGSFTGLRVGVTVAKTLAFAVDAQTVGVGTLETLSTRVAADREPICASLREYFDVLPPNQTGFVLSAAVDAQRGEVAAERFFLPFDSSRPPVPLDDRFQILSYDDWFEDRFLPSENSSEISEKSLDNLMYEKGEISPRNGFGPTVLCGPIPKRRAEKISPNLSRRFVPETYRDPKAVGVAETAWRRAQKGAFDDRFALLPIYARLSAAEEKLKKKQTKF